MWRFTQEIYTDFYHCSVSMHCHDIIVLTYIYPVSQRQIHVLVDILPWRTTTMPNILLPMATPVAPRRLRPNMLTVLVYIFDVLTV